MVHFLGKERVLRVLELVIAPLDVFFHGNVDHISLNSYSLGVGGVQLLLRITILHLHADLVDQDPAALVTDDILVLDWKLNMDTC